MLRVALVGAGLIGEPIAAHLLDRGFSVAIVAHRNRAPIERLARRVLPNSTHSQTRRLRAMLRS